MKSSQILSNDKICRLRGLWYDIMLPWKYIIYIYVCILKTQNTLWLLYAYFAELMYFVSYIKIKILPFLCMYIPAGILLCVYRCNGVYLRACSDVGWLLVWVFLQSPWAFAGRFLKNKPAASVDLQQKMGIH